MKWILAAFFLAGTPSASLASPHAVEMVAAAERGDLSEVKTLLDSGVPANSSIQEEISIGCCYTSPSQGEKHAIHAAAKSGHLEIVKLLLEKGEKPNVVDTYGVQPIYYAANNGHLEIVSLLLDKGANVNATTGRNEASEYGGSRDVLNFAIAQQNQKLVEFLVNHGADTSVSAISAASLEDLGILKFLLAHGANPLATDKQGYGNQPIHSASFSGNVDAMQLLISLGADAQTPDASGELPIHMASRSGKLQPVAFLLKHEAKATAAIPISDDNSCGGMQPLHWLAVTQGSPDTIEIAKLLIDNGADARAADQNGYTPLHNADDIGLVNILLDHGASVDAVTFNTTQQPLHCAASAGNLEKISLLVARGAKINVKDYAEKTPLDQAAFWGREEAVALLLKLGSKVTPETTKSAIDSQKPAVLKLVLANGGTMPKNED